MEYYVSTELDFYANNITEIQADAFKVLKCEYEFFINDSNLFRCRISFFFQLVSPRTNKTNKWSPRLTRLKPDF